MKENMMIFLTSQPPAAPDPDLPEEFNWIQNPALRRVVGKYLKDGYSCDAGGRGLRPLRFWHRWPWAYFGKGKKGVLVIEPLVVYEADPSTPLSQKGIDAVFGSILSLVTRLMANGRPLQDLHLPGGGNIPIPRWFLHAMSALGINVHVDGEQVSRAEPRPDVPRE